MGISERHRHPEAKSFKCFIRSDEFYLYRLESSSNSAELHGKEHRAAQQHHVCLEPGWYLRENIHYNARKECWNGHVAWCNYQYVYENLCRNSWFIVIDCYPLLYYQSSESLRMVSSYIHFSMNKCAIYADTVLNAIMVGQIVAYRGNKPKTE